MILEFFPAMPNYLFWQNNNEYLFSFKKIIFKYYEQRNSNTVLIHVFVRIKWLKEKKTGIF